MKATFEELAALQKEGKIEHIGVSNFGVKQLEEALSTGVKIATNQLMYNLLSRAIEFDVIPLCQKHDIGVIGYSPLLQGIVTDKGAKLDSFDEVSKYRLRTRHFNGKRDMSRHEGEGVEKEMLVALKKIAAIAEREKLSVSTLAMAWCLANPAVVTIIPGARNVDQVRCGLPSCAPSMDMLMFISSFEPPPNSSKPTSSLPTSIFLPRSKLSLMQLRSLSRPLLAHTLTTMPL